MKKLAYAALALVAATSQSHADWKLDVDQDPISDEKFAVMMGAGDNQTLVGAKCWENDARATILIVGLPIPYDQAATYKDTVDVKFRVDSGAVHDVLLVPTELGGNLSFMSPPDQHEVVLTIIREWSGAKKRIALALEGFNHTASPRGTKKAVEGFLSACGLGD